MRVLMPLPSHDFDPTEAAVPWRSIVRAGHEVIFATPNGVAAIADQRMVTGEGLGVWKSILRADSAGRASYEAMVEDNHFQEPKTWDSVKAEDFDGLILPGGHAPGMKDYLESARLQSLTSQFFEMRKAVGAICHGVVLAARSRDAQGLSVLHKRMTTALLSSQELLAGAITAPWLGSYYRTYPQTVEAEVRSVLAAPSQFQTGPLPVRRDRDEALHLGFALVDGSYVSARWPGDAHRFAKSFLKVLESQKNP